MIRLQTDGFTNCVETMHSYSIFTMSSEPRHPDQPRRSFRRTTALVRRRELIRATLDCIAESGMHAATVREIAERVGVSNGLIRHHFATKEQMIQEAYRVTMAEMTALSRAAGDSALGLPRERLRRYVAANLGPPVCDAKRLTLWASFIAMIHLNPPMAEIHREAYLEFRKDIELLLAEAFAAEGSEISAEECRLMAIKINAVIDGLWLEGSLDPDLFAPGELLSIGLEAVEEILGLPLEEATKQRA